jgi:hypothetical protein
MLKPVQHDVVVETSLWVYFKVHLSGNNKIDAETSSA